MTTTEQEFQRGRNAIVYFNNVLVREFNGKNTVDQMIAIIQSRPMQKNFVQGLGLGIISASVTENNVKSGMENLARKGGGKIPATNGAFTQAIANDVRDNISYVDASFYVATESTKNIVDGLQKIGDEVISYGSFFTNNLWTIPVILFGGFIVYQKLLSKV